jgi:long-chain acyl-CoA synthetase
MEGTVVGLLEATAAWAPAKAAVLFGDRSMTYSELRQAAATAGAGLRAMGVGPGEHVALILPNLPEFAVAYFGSLYAGAVVTPVNVTLKAEELAHILGDSGARAVVTLGQFAAVVREASAALPSPPLIVQVDGDPGPGGVDVRQLLAKAMAGAAGPAPRGPDDVAVCLYTSGTTGQPKGALLTHANLVANVRACQQVFRWTEDDVALCALPLFHSFAATVLLLLPVSVGVTVALEPRFVPDAVARAIASRRATVFCGVPAMYAAWARAGPPPADLTAWRVGIAGGAPLPVEVLRAFEARFPARLYEGYGLTETAPVVTVNPIDPEARRVGTAGRAIPGVEVRIEGPDGQARGPGEVGEVAVRGPNVMRGYLNQPAATAEALRGGWFHTGDLGRLDGEGFLTIVDRLKDMIIVGGLNVYPREVEEVLAQHPKLAEVAVVGAADALRGEVPRAVVAPREGVEVSEREVLQFCRERLAGYKVPREVEVRPSLPKTATGKVMKHLLR